MLVADETQNTVQVAHLCRLAYSRLGCWRLTPADINIVSIGTVQRIAAHGDSDSQLMALT